MTVRQTVQALVDGAVTLRSAFWDLEARTEWDRAPVLTAVQHYEDLPPTGDNSPDQIDLVGHSLSASVRAQLWDAARRAMR